MRSLSDIIISNSLASTSATTNLCFAGTTIPPNQRLSFKANCLGTIGGIISMICRYDDLDLCTGQATEDNGGF